VNNSGVAAVKPLVETTPAEWRRILETNLTGAFNCCRAVGPAMIARKRGKVVNVASVLGARGLPGYAAYSASKGGLLALTRALAVEWARHNIQVNAIAPGWFVTSMNEAAFEDPADERAPSPARAGAPHRPPGGARAAGGVPRVRGLGVRDGRGRLRRRRPRRRMRAS
jgi:NAD(P)-dependent dehydrogenase (short-subunit alcohol dehydrogenase family)